MKTRIVHTRIWQDEFYASLAPEEKLLFLYFLTNDQVNIIHCYELPDRNVLFDTGVTRESLEAAKAKFQAADKIYFYKGYIYLKNASRYEKYEGEDNKKAKRTLISQLNQEVYNWFISLKDTPLSEGCDTLPTGTINHKSKIINQKQEIRNNTLPEKVQAELGKIENIVKPKYSPVTNTILLFFLLAIPFLYPVKTFAKTLRLKITLRTGLAPKTPTKSTVTRQPRPQLAKNTAPDAIYRLEVYDYTPEAYMVYRQMAIAKSEAIFGVDHNQNLVSLWNHEAHFNPWAGNPTSGACGIPQAYPCQKLLDKCGSLDNVDCQIDWGLEYIKNRYSNPTAAYKFWLDRHPINGVDVGHWY